MSEWNRNYRDEGYRQRETEARRTPDREGGRYSEHRTFGERSDPRGGRQGRDFREPGPNPYQGEGFPADNRYGNSYYAARAYGAPEAGLDSYSGAGYAREWDQPSRSSAPSDRYEGRYDARQERGRYEGRAYGDRGAAFGDPNEAVRRVTDGDDGGGVTGLFGARSHRGRGPRNYTRSDERIREDVNDRLSDDHWIDATEIDVQVAQGEVTLVGSVESREEKRLAEDLAERVAGVKHVQNNLRVQPTAARG